MLSKENVKLTKKKAYIDAKELFLTGEYQQKEIAEKFGVTVQTVCRWVKKWKAQVRMEKYKLESLFDIAMRTENRKDREYLSNLYKQLIGGI